MFKIKFLVADFLNPGENSLARNFIPVESTAQFLTLGYLGDPRIKSGA
jgi:hypothetical protein